jgi:hypothetical protein
MQPASDRSADNRPHLAQTLTCAIPLAVRSKPPDPLSLSDPASGPPPDHELVAQSARYGTVRVQAWRNMHQELGRSGHWAGWPPDTRLPIVAGTIIRVSVEYLPGGRKPHKDIWLFHSGPPGVEPDLDLLWKAYLRRFDQEHFHRLLVEPRIKAACIRAGWRWLSARPGRVIETSQP